MGFLEAKGLFGKVDGGHGKVAEGKEVEASLSRATRSQRQSLITFNLTALNLTSCRGAVTPSNDLNSPLIFRLDKC